MTRGVDAAVAAALAAGKIAGSCGGSGAAEEAGGVVVVCGSIFLMAEARAALGFREPRDP